MTKFVPAKCLQHWWASPSKCPTVGPTALAALIAVWLLICNSSPCAEAVPEDAPHTLPRQMVIAVAGGAGDAQYGEMFAEWVDNWKQAATTASAEFAVIGHDEHAEPDRERLEQLLTEVATKDLDRLWIVLVGHGTYDGHAAKFNLRGPDVTATELADWLASVTAPTVVINCASASEPFLKPLSARHRIVVTATRSGYELNFARFGKYLSEAIVDVEADLDKDDQVSLLEAYLTACRRLQEYYEQDARLMTEHALLDDNGDGLGTPADWFRGVRAIKRPKEGAEMDGMRAHQAHLVVSEREARLPAEVRARRDHLEQEASALRDKKSELSDEEYYEQLESIMLELARIYKSTEIATER